MGRLKARQTMTPRRALLLTRLIWAALLLWTLLVFGLVCVAGWRGLPGAGFPRAAGGIALAVILLACGFRGGCYKRGWRGEVVVPGFYLAGNLVLFAALGAGALAAAGLVSRPEMGGRAAGMLLFLGVFALALANCPHGKPMRAG